MTTGTDKNKQKSNMEQNNTSMAPSHVTTTINNNNNNTFDAMATATNTTPNAWSYTHNVTDDVAYNVTASSSPNVTAGWSDVTSTLNVTVSDAVVTTLRDALFSSTPDATVTSLPLMTSSDTSDTSTTVMDDNVTVTALAQRVANSIDFWLPPFLFFIGIVTNVLVILVMQSKHFRHMSTSFYMCVSSIFDLASLLVSLPAHYLYVNFPEVFDNVRDAHAMCSVFNLFGWGSSDMGVLLTVAMTTERSLAIQFPLKAPTLCTVKRAKIVTVCLFLLELLKVGHLVFTSRVAKKEVTAYLCDVDLQTDHSYAVFYTYYWPYIHNVFLLLAFIVIIIGNIIIAVHVKRSEDSRDMGEGAKNAGGAGGAGGGGGGGKMVSRSRQLSLMLIIDSATIVICTLPFAIYVVIDQAFSLFEDSEAGRGEHSLVFSIVFYLLYVNRCANFFLYCVSGARFRQALKDILSGSSARQRQQNYVTGMTNTRNATSSACTGDTDGKRVSMNPMGPSTSTSTGAMNGTAGKRLTTTSLTGPTALEVAGVTNARPKLERHYGYVKNTNGK